MNTAWRMLDTSLVGEGMHSAELSAPSSRAQFILQVIGMYEAMPLGMEVPLQMKRVRRGDHFSVG